MHPNLRLESTNSPRGVRRDDFHVNVHQIFNSNFQNKTSWPPSVTALRPRPPRCLMKCKCSRCLLPRIATDRGKEVVVESRIGDESAALSANDKVDVADEAPKGPSHKNMRLYLAYFDVCQESASNRWFQCKKCKRRGQNATFARPHLLSCFAADLQAMDDYRKTFPGEKMAVQTSISRLVTSEAPKEKPTQKEFERLLARLVVRHSLPFSTMDWKETHEVLSYALRDGQG